MQRRLLIVILVTLAVTPPALMELNRPTATTGDPCDSYGNCISSSINYVRSNPDQSLYFGDEFSVVLSTSTGPNTTSVSIGWSYDSAVLSALGGGLFKVVGNVTGTYFVTVTETFTVTEAVGNSMVTIQSPLSTSVSVETRAFRLAFQTNMSNFTNPAHQVLRNPDGSFFHRDSFFVQPLTSAEALCASCRK